MPILRNGQDGYGKTVCVGDRIVFSWGGILNKATVEDIKRGSMRSQLTVVPDGYEGKTTAKVKDSRSTVIISKESE